MKIAVNLASHPYVELRPVYARLRTWMAILAVLGVVLWFLYHNERGQAAEAMARVSSVENHVTQLERQQQSYRTLMQQPKDAAILDQSDFLNDLFKQKAFSWTATMSDLETVLPAGVQVLSIDPIVAKDGHVTIRLRVTGQRDRALELLRNLEGSKHFALPRLASEQLANNTAGQGGFQNTGANPNEVNFDILADYRPLPIPVNGKSEEEKPAEAEKTPESTTPAKAATHRAAPRAKGTAKAGPHRARQAGAAAGGAQHP